MATVLRYGWKLDDSDPAKLRYWKEAIYEGSFQKRIDSKAVPFKITRDTIDHLVETYRKFTENGNEVPHFCSHVESSENRLGTIVDVKAENDSKGRYALFTLIEFNGEEAAAIGLANQVSVYIPPEYEDGKGNVYEWPLKHLASTPNPGIPGLDPYVALAASNDFVLSLAVEYPMDEILKALGIDPPDEGADVTALVLKAIEDMQKKMSSMSDSEEEETPPVEAGDKPAVEMSLPTIVIDQISSSRSREVDSLVKSRTVTPAHADELRAQYCSSKAVGLALSNDGGDGFDILIKNLTKSAASVRASLPVEGLTLDHTGDDGNCLVSDAKSREGAN